MSKNELLKQCQGFRRYGGAFTLGPVRWEQCKEAPIVLITLISGTTGKPTTMPACNTCWLECINQKVELIKVEPYKSTRKDLALNMKTDDFKVKAAYTDRKRTDIDLSVTHNGYQWSTVFIPVEKIPEVIAALKGPTNKSTKRRK
jgi:hypothetical protein